MLNLQLMGEIQIILGFICHQPQWYFVCNYLKIVPWRCHDGIYTYPIFNDLFCVDISCFFEGRCHEVYVFLL